MRRAGAQTESGGCSSQLNCQLMPNLSVQAPKYAPQNISSSGATTTPPSEIPAKSSSVSSRLVVR